MSDTVVIPTRPTDKPLAPLPPGVTIPDTVAELQVEWGDGEFWLALFVCGRRPWSGTVREGVARARIEGLTMPPIGRSSTGKATFEGPLGKFNDAEIQRPNGDPVARVDSPGIAHPHRLYRGQELIVHVTLRRLG